MEPNLMTTPPVQAARLLAAWSSRNSDGFRAELQRTLGLNCPIHPRALHEEQWQLLHAAAGGIQQAGEPLHDDDPMLQSCLHLLRHLARG
jgi:hypothetical protein